MDFASATPGSPAAVVGGGLGLGDSLSEVEVGAPAVSSVQECSVNWGQQHQVQLPLFAVVERQAILESYHTAEFFVQ